MKFQISRLMGFKVGIFRISPIANIVDLTIITKGVSVARVVCALDYEAGNLGLIPGSGGTTNWFFSAGWYCYQQYRPRMDNRGANDMHPGLCWK